MLKAHLSNRIEEHPSRQAWFLNQSREIDGYFARAHKKAKEDKWCHDKEKTVNGQAHYHEEHAVSTE
jgi:hypothetical protein